MTNEIKIPPEVLDLPDGRDWDWHREVAQTVALWVRQSCERAIEKKLSELRASKEPMAPMWDYGCVLALNEVRKVGGAE